MIILRPNRSVLIAVRQLTSTQRNVIRSTIIHYADVSVSPASEFGRFILEVCIQHYAHLWKTTGFSCLWSRVVNENRSTFYNVVI